MGSRETLAASVVEISNQDLMVHEGTKLSRSHEVYAIKVRNINDSLVGRGVVFSVFVDVQGE